jgi:hypothetical protein
MTLQAGDKLMSLTEVSEMLGIPVPARGRRRLAGTTSRPTLTSTQETPTLVRGQSAMWLAIEDPP